jgi:hypothetical protein
MSLTKPMLGLAVGGTLGLLDGLSGFLEPSLAPLMTSVITFSLLKGLLSGITIGYLARKFTRWPSAYSRAYWSRRSSAFCWC